MGLYSEDIVPINQVRSRFNEIAKEVRAGAEKLITRNGESYVALVDSRRLDYYHRLEREHVHLTLLEEALKGIEELSSGKSFSVEELRGHLRPKPKPKKRTR